MTSITRLPSAGPAQAATRPTAGPTAGSGARFAVTDPAPVTLPATVARTAAVAGLQHLLLGCQDDDPRTVDDRGRRRARALLTGLAALQLRLLDGGAADDAGAADLLGGLRTQLKDLPAPLDPALAAALAAVALRVEIELARRGLD